MDKKRVTVVIDRADRTHAEFWTEILHDIKERHVLDATVQFVPLADFISAPLKPDQKVFIGIIEDETDILILNWDAVNGDPDFGGDVARAWFEHRQFALRRWLNHGGLLILEGQAAQGVPHDKYYSAVLGDEEVRLSGRTDPRRPDSERRRMVGDCRMTRIGKSAPGFDDLDHIQARADLTFEQMFPPDTAGRFIPEYLRMADSSKLLYRGWFRRRVHLGSLAWVPYVRRANRWPVNFPTMLVAKCNNNGLVFATTLLLSATRQTQLIQAMLLAHGNGNSFPETGALRRAGSRYLPEAVGGFVVTLVLLLFGRADTVERLAVAALAGLVATLLLNSLPGLWRLAGRLLRVFSGA